MEERIPQPREEARAPTVSEPAPTAGKPCDALLAPVVKRRSSSSGEESSSSSSDDDDEGEQREFDIDFEFPFVSRDSPAGTAAPADELFADGRIRAFYPVFGRGAGCVVARGSTSTSTSSCTALPAAPPPRVRGQLGQLFLEETRERSNSSTSSSTSSSLGAATDDDGGLEGAAPESYCVWRPAGPSASSSSASPRPQTPRKSGSTGSMARPRWRRISDLVVGRSHSDGREKFLFLAAAPPAHHDAPRRHYKKPATGTATAPAAGAYCSKPPPPPPPVAAPATEAAGAAAHRMAYLARGGVPVPPGATPRRTFLPYREELVGFFANVNGISRSHHHPF